VGYVWGIFIHNAEAACSAVDRSTPSPPSPFKDEEGSSLGSSLSLHPTAMLSRDDDDEETRSSAMVGSSDRVFDSKVVTSSNSYDSASMDQSSRESVEGGREQGLNASPRVGVDPSLDVEKPTSDNLVNNQLLPGDIARTSNVELVCDVLLLSRSSVTKPKKQRIPISRILGRFDEARALKCLYGKYIRARFIFIISRGYLFAMDSHCTKRSITICLFFFVVIFFSLQIYC